MLIPSPSELQAAVTGCRVWQWTCCTNSSGFSHLKKNKKQKNQTKKIQLGILSALSCSTLCFLACKFKLCNNIYIQMLTVIFPSRKKEMSFKSSWVWCKAEIFDLQRGRVHWNCLKRDCFLNKWHSCYACTSYWRKGHFAFEKIVLRRGGMFFGSRLQSCLWKLFIIQWRWAVKLWQTSKPCSHWDQ